ncbi:AraC family transcriptional regulator [Kosakonia radicincitans UMEnt01/12]|uniref:helix-turn-helix transcriptional regulator n=1 Tax=Kosakonia radicincitans TaxID=283686 RepID=UPI0004619868|nr:AraC family transcriptional regulator [Kosakonia radicincitans]KDE33902.1 AraC family transcriptional regulator [Kosakonia radicincitans UMEnt01/12]
MADNWQTERLELITLNDAVASFSRLFANTVRYHHWHQCLEVLYVEEGFGVVIVDNRQYTMRPGRLFFFPPLTIHKVMVDEQAQASYRRTIIHVDHHAILRYFRDFPHNHSRLQRLSQRGGAAVVMDAAAIHAHIDHLFSGYARLAASAKLNGEQVACLLLNLLSMLPEESEKLPEEGCGIATPVMFWLEENYQQKFSLEKLAQELGKSRSYISRRFHEETGEPINHYLNTIRLRKACDYLLHSPHSIRDIAALVGFSDVTWFISAFRKGIGETPLQYRKNHASQRR